MTEDAFQESVRNLRNHVGQLEREGDYWSDEDRERLRTMFGQGVGITEIAIRLQRTEPAVFQQIEKLDLYERKDRPRRRKSEPKPIPAPCECLCSVCEVDPNSCPNNQRRKERGPEDAGAIR